MSRHRGRDESDAAKWRNWTLLWAAVIFATSCTVVQSKSFVHAVSTGTPIAISERGFQRFWSSWWWVFVKGYHVMEFALLTYLLCLWLRRRPVWVPVLIAATYAASDEIHQIWVPERGARVTDWLIDLIGVTLATVVWVTVGRSKARPSDPT